MENNYRSQKETKKQTQILKTKIIITETKASIYVYNSSMEGKKKP